MKEPNTLTDTHEQARNDRAVSALHNGIVREVERGEKEIECPVTHHFSDGVYIREMFIPKGTLIAGRVHKTKHINILLKGSLTVFSKDGKKELSAPYTFESTPGVRKIALCHSDCIWQNIHVTDSTDLVEIEKSVVEAKDYSEDIEFIMQKYNLEVL